MEYNMSEDMTQDEIDSFDLAKSEFDVSGFERYIGDILSEDGTRMGRAMQWDHNGIFTGVKFWFI